MKLTVLTDSETSWFVPFGKKLSKKLNEKGHSAVFITDSSEIKNGDICFLLSCTKLVSKETLDKNKYNIVVHASDLPKGKGFSPLQWQVAQGQNDITLTLFEVVEEMDAGPYYFKESISFDGHELLVELREKMALKIIDMCLRFVSGPEEFKPKNQTGESTYFKRRTFKDDELDVNLSIAEQFNHFRIADNDNYPIFFKMNGHRYTLKIERVD